MIFNQSKTRRRAVTFVAAFLYIMHVVVHYIYVKENVCAVKKGERNEH